MTDETKAPIDRKLARPTATGCSFCVKKRDETGLLIQGTDAVAICEDCVALSVQICAEHITRTFRNQGSKGEAATPQPVAADNPEGAGGECWCGRCQHLAEAKKQITMSLPAAIRHIIDHLESQPTVAQKVARLCLAAIDDAHPTSTVGAPLTKLAEAAERESKRCALRRLPRKP